MIRVERPPLPSLRVGLDAAMVGLVAVIAALGLVMVASASIALAQQNYGQPFYFFWRQSVFLLMGLALAAAAFCVPMHVWERRSGYLALAALAMLLLVLLPGVGINVNNAQRWIDFGIVRLQVSEPARVALLMFMAGYIVRRQGRLQNTWKGLLMPFLPLFLAGFLLMMEPDFGATVILFTVAFVMLFLGGARVSHLLVLGALALVGIVALVFAAAYRVRRLLVFLDPFKDQSDAGYQLSNSLIAVGLGGASGVGLGNSQQKLLFLPEMHTDFIFAILAEEFGFVGVLLLLGLFAGVVWRGFVIGSRAEGLGERFKAYLAYGLSSWLGLQVLVNLAVNLGALPTKGLTLPLISYGGSSLISTLVTLALLLRVDYENRLLTTSSQRPPARPMEVGG